jgi:hypothetical protein
MPFKNCAQVKALFAKNPALARKWKKKYGIPDHCKDPDKKKEKK